MWTFTKFLTPFLKPGVIFHDTTRLYNFSSHVTYFWQKYPIKLQIFGLFTAQVKIHQISHVIFQTKSEFFFKKFKWLFSVMRDNSCTFFFLLVLLVLYFFSWNCTWFGQNEPIKVQSFKLSTGHVKFYQVCTLIGSLKYKFLAKKYRGVISHDPEDWCKIWRKTDLLFQKWQEFGEIWPEHSQVSKTCTFICSYCAKYLMFDLKKYRGVIFHDTEGWCKIWRKTDLWFGKWHEEYGKFSPEQFKVSKLG